MSQQPEFSAMGRHYLQIEAYGAASFCFYQAIMEDSNNENAWNGLVLAQSLMRKEQDSQTVLARFALQEEPLEFDKDMVTFAMMVWQQNPNALGAWVRAVTNAPGIGEEDKHLLSQMADDLEKGYQELVEKHGEQVLKLQGMLSLQEMAGRRMELDWLAQEGFSKILVTIKQWIDDSDNALNAVRMLCMLPDPQSEKLLRRIARNEDIDAKVRTQAILALKWLGVQGNARIAKFGESFIINLDNPEPELTVTVPQAFKPVLDRMRLWLAKQQGIITVHEYESHVSNDETDMPEELAAKANEADFPAILQEVAHMLLRAAYDQYYPLVPTVTGMRQWSAGLLLLLKDYTEGLGGNWPYGDPEEDDVAIRHRNWLLSGSPDFYDSLDAAKAQLKVQDQGQDQEQAQE
jgi:hypothetical protein